MRQRLLHAAVLALFFYLTFLINIAEQALQMRMAHQIIMAAILGAWVLSLWRGRRPWPTTRFDAPILALLVAWGVAAVTSTDPRVSLETYWNFLVQALLFFLFVDLMRQGHRHWILEGLFLAGGVVVIITGIEMVAWYFGLPVVPRFVEGWPQLHGLTLPPRIHTATMALGNANYQAAYCVPIIPFAWMWGSSSALRDQRIGLRLLSVALAVVVLLTQSRGGLIALAVIVGGLLLEWLLRAETRQRLPAWMQPITQPRHLLLLAGVVALVGIVGVGWYITRAPSGSDLARLDLWYSATEMFRDHPLTGAGPGRFGLVRLQYAIWEGSSRLLRIPHAHNIVFHLLAEGGLLVFTAFVWLIVRTARVWMKNLPTSSNRQRRRLIGIGIAFAAVAAYNQVDTFGRTVQLVPLLVMLALLAHIDTQRAPVSQTASRVPLAAAATALIAAQIAFIPVYRGALAQQRALSHLSQDQFDDALSAVRDAQNHDPWLDLYELQEAYILGLLANDDPEAYLEMAVAAHEQTLEMVPVWELGWHNLAALYAQQGRYDAAIAAEQRALAMTPGMADYHLNLGTYYEAVGDETRAKEEYWEALRLRPYLASAAIWSSPLRQEALRQASAQLSDEPVTAFDVAVLAGDFDQARALARQHPDSKTIQSKAEALWPDDGPPCLRCFLVHGVDAFVEIERGLTTDTDEAEQKARTMIFTAEGGSATAWYMLARVREIEGADADVIDTLLLRSVRPPGDHHAQFATTGYNTNATLQVLPQARVPTLFPLTYEPWVRLAERLTDRQEYEDARRVYEAILDYAPDAAQVQQALRALPEANNNDVS